MAVASATFQKEFDIMPYAQIFTYTLDIPEEEYATRWASYAKEVAEVPGLLSKTWIADFETATFASFYVWDSKASADRFMASALVARFGAEPFLRDLSITAAPVAEGASRITRGLPG